MRKFLFIPLALVAMAAACEDSDIEKVATALNTATKTVGGVQDATILAFDSGLFSDDVNDEGEITQTAKEKADVIVEICKEVQMAVVLANNLTREFSELPAGGRDQVLEILIPVIETLEVAVSEEKITLITNDNLRAAVALGFRTALGFMQTAQAILEAGDAN